MLTGEIRQQVDRVWDAFWSGGIANPFEVIEQMTYLLFIKRLDELQLRKEAQANRLKQPIEDPIFTEEQKNLRWSVFKNFDPRQPVQHDRGRCFPVHQKPDPERRQRVRFAHARCALHAATREGGTAGEGGGFDQ